MAKSGDEGRRGDRGGLPTGQGEKALPKSQYVGNKATRMSSLALPSSQTITSGKSGRRTNTLRNYGGVVVHTTRSSGTTWANVYSQNGYLIGRFSSSPITGKVGNLNKAAAEVAKLTNFKKLTQSNVSKDQGEKLQGQINSIWREYGLIG